MQDLAVVIHNENENITPLETIDAIKAAGFVNVFIQWYNEPWECNQEEQLKYIKKLGLNVIFAHLGYKQINSIWEAGNQGEKLVEKYKNDIRVCKDNDITTVVMHLTGGPVPPVYNKEGLDRIKRISDYARSMGVKIAFENTKVKGYLEYVLDNISDNNVGICYDAGHCHAHFDDEFNYSKFKDRIIAVHLHDNDTTKDHHWLPFDGTIDWKFVIKNLRENNYGGPISLELCYRSDYINIDPLEFYKKGYKAGKKLAAMF